MNSISKTPARARIRARAARKTLRALHERHEPSALDRVHRNRKSPFVPQPREVLHGRLVVHLHGQVAAAAVDLLLRHDERQGALLSERIDDLHGRFLP